MNPKLEVGDWVELLYKMQGFKSPIRGIVRALFYEEGDRARVGCKDANGRKFVYDNASIGNLKKIKGGR